MDNKMNRILSLRICTILLSVAAGSMILFSCRTTQPTIDSKDLSYLYNPTKSSIKPLYDILNETDESTVLSVKFFASELFFSEANPQGIPIAQILMTIKLYNIDNGMTLKDTANLNLRIIKDESRRDYVYRVPLRVEPGFNYVAEVKILDRLRLEVIQAFVNFNTLSVTNRYNFMARGHFGKNELFNPILHVNEFADLVYSRGPVDSLYISYYEPLRQIPYPPSMLLPEKTIDYDPDTVIAFAYSDTLPLMFPKDGLYFCTVGRDLQDGFTFFNFGDKFPTMTTPEVMIEPLAYLASEDEMNEMRSSARPKMALDDFWLKCAGNVEKARELIRIYYTRILYSNYYFTSYKEGWRTERGMIYTIYGPPDKVYKATGGESWGYRKQEIRSSWGGRYHLKDDYIWFNFRTREDKFSGNDFFLSRSETLVTFWDQAVASWRKGIVFRLDNPEGI
jgi:GWxTD domain-containing protein